MTSRRSSGSSAAERAVEPTRSQNITVSCRRSAAEAGAAWSTGVAARARRHLHRAGHRRRSDRRRLGARTIGRRRSAEPCGPSASLGRAGGGGHYREYAPPSWRSFRVPRARRRRGQGNRRVDTSLAGTAPEHGCEPVRSIAWTGVDPAGRSRPGDRFAVATLGARQGRRGPSRAGLGRTWDRQIAPRRGASGAPPVGTTYSTTLFLLALLPGQRAVSLHRPARPSIWVRTQRSGPGQAGEARSLTHARRGAGRRRGTRRRSHVIVSFGAISAAQPQSAAQEGKDTGGAARPARRSGAPAAGGHGLRGRPLDRSNFARIARSHRRADPQPADTIDHHIPSRIPAALGRPAAGDDAGARSPGPK